ncbi:MAG: ferritin-like domain-containing protein [Archangium sp.]|nr:ferritin-like domain-containing protein [Archangium sp.]
MTRAPVRAKPLFVWLFRFQAIALAGFLLAVEARFGVAPFSEAKTVAAWLMLVGMLGAVAVGFASLIRIIGATMRPEPVAALTWVGLFSAGASSLGGLLATTVGLSSTISIRGRQLRRRGKVLLPSVGQGDAWAELSMQPEIPGELTEALARRWRENGRNEHASVAAFAHLTLDLMAVGAPPQLLTDAQRDAADEIRHAELCFSLARAIDGQPESPSPFLQAHEQRPAPSSRPEALAQLAADSLIEGALLEGFSARTLAVLVQRCEDPATVALLKELAADEGRHSRHGWDVAEWCLAEGGAAVAEALRRAADQLPTSNTPATNDEATDGRWERYGIAGAALEAQMFQESRAYVVQRVQQLLGAARLAA